MKKLEYIPINIWDDFYDDGYVPEGEKLETYIYVEDSDMPQEKRKECLDTLLDYINKNLNTNGIKQKTYVHGMGVLENVDIKVDGIPFHIYVHRN